MPFTNNKGETPYPLAYWVMLHFDCVLRTTFFSIAYCVPFNNECNNFSVLNYIKKNKYCSIAINPCFTTVSLKCPKYARSRRALEKCACFDFKCHICRVSFLKTATTLWTFWGVHTNNKTFVYCVPNFCVLRTANCNSPWILRTERGLPF